MKRFLTCLAVILASVSLLATTAEAKRFGGGSSIGKQRTITPQQVQKAPAAAPAQTAPAQTTPAQPSGNKWLGPLAGLAIGAGLGALLANAGLDGALGGILLALLAAAAVIFLIAKFRRPQPQRTMQYASTGAPYHEPPAAQQPLASAAAPTAPPTTGAIPDDFPVDSFLRSARTTFIRLQTANDRKDLNDIHEYTTPEMFAEISMQMQERGAAPQKTDVLSVDARLLEVANEGSLAIASVRFTGQLRENGGTPEGIDEIWHVQKDLGDSRSVWLLVGIQQTVLR